MLRRLEVDKEDSKMERKIRFIINPAAGKGSGKNLLSIIHQMMEEEKVEYDIKISGHQGHITALAREAVVLQYTDIVVAGGDGTIIEAVNGMIGSPLRLGIFPYGTGNDFARSIGLPDRPEDQMKRILEMKTKSCDIGLVNGQAFLNSVGIGIDSEVVKTTAQVKGFLPGSMAYGVSTIKAIISYKPKSVRLKIDGAELSRSVMLVAVGNGQYIGGGMKITPGASLDSEDFEICVVRDVSTFRFLKLFPHVFKGTHISIPEVEMFKGHTIEIHCEDHALPVNADGTLVGVTPARIELHKWKIYVLC